MVNRHVAVSLKKDTATATAKESKKRSHALVAVTSPVNAELVEDDSDDDRFTSPTNKGKKVAGVQSQRSHYQWTQNKPCNLKILPTRPYKWVIATQTQMHKLLSLFHFLILVQSTHTIAMPNTFKLLNLPG